MNANSLSVQSYSSTAVYVGSKIEISASSSFTINGDNKGTTPSTRTESKATIIYDGGGTSTYVSQCCIGSYNDSVNYSKNIEGQIYASVRYITIMQSLYAIVRGFISLSSYNHYYWPFNASGSSQEAQFILNTGPQWKQICPTFAYKNYYGVTTTNTTTTNYSYNNMKINNSNTWKTANQLKLNVGGTWKTLPPTP